MDRVGRGEPMSPGGVSDAGRGITVFPLERLGSGRYSSGGPWAYLWSDDPVAERDAEWIIDSLAEILI